MPVKFSQFATGGNIVAGDILVGLRNGVNTQFAGPSIPFLPWSNISASGPLAYDNGYFCVNVGPISLSLPAVAPYGSSIQIVNVFGNQITITQGANQTIQVGSNSTTLGATGTLTSSTTGDAIILVCYIANLSFIASTAPQGIWTTA